MKELYKVLIGDPDEAPELFKCEEWKNFGFQGINPRTDFRGGGHLSLEAILYFA
jgi:hypothetical protein